MSVPDANDPQASGPPTQRPPRGWRLAAIGAAAVAAIVAAVAVVFGVGRIPAPPPGLGDGGAGDVGARRPIVADTDSTAPPPWAVPASPPTAPREPPRAAAVAPDPASRRGRRPAAPAAYPPAIEDAIHAALESGRSQPWNALGVKGWVTVSAAGGSDHACRAYRVVRDTGATAPQTLCRAPDGRWRADL